MTDGKRVPEVRASLLTYLLNVLQLASMKKCLMRRLMMRLGKKKAKPSK